MSKRKPPESSEEFAQVRGMPDFRLITTGTFLPGQGLTASDRATYASTLRKMLPQPVSQVLCGEGRRFHEMRVALGIAHVGYSMMKQLGTDSAPAMMNVHPLPQVQKEILGTIIRLPENAVILADPAVAGWIGYPAAKELSAYRLTFLPVHFELLIEAGVYHHKAI